MEYKKELIELLEKVANDGLEGAIPTLISEALKEMKLQKTTNEQVLYYTAYHCDKKN